MLIKPLSPRILWIIAILGTVYLYVAFSVQFPAGYWGPFTPVPANPASQPECATVNHPNDRLSRISPLKSTGIPAGWDYDPIVGDWVNSPTGEDYESLMSDRDKTLLDELFLYTGSSKPKSSRINQFYNLDTDEDWKDYINRLDEEGLAPLTKFAQRYIRNHQHPIDCTNKKFIVFGKFPNDESFGLGAVIQSIAAQLALAIRTDRILIYDPVSPPGMHFIQSSDPEHGSFDPCGQSLDCIFHKLTSCTHADVARARDTIYYPWRTEVPEVFFRTHPNSLPPVLGLALQRLLSDMIGDSRKYWWRGQAAAYVMRLNGRTMKRLRELRMDPKLHQGFHLAKGSHPNAGTELKMVYPVPEGAFSMHVRHGDKGIEMNLVSFQKYILQAEEHFLRNPMSARRIAFLSTEDPGVIAEARNISSLLALSSKKGWEWYWSNIPRSNDGPETQLQLFGNRTEMTIKWLLQLTMALECDNFVGTRGSGWNRLIDQLRCTWHSNCRSPYLEVGDDKSWAHYGF